MSYREWFDHGGRWYKSDASQEVRIYVQDPAKRKLSEIGYLDESAARAIQEAQQLIADLTEYRQALAVRYAEPDAAPYHFRLELERRREGYRDVHVWYYVRIIKVYEDGTETTEMEESYPGPERNKAFARYAALQKERPGIELWQSTEKGAWER